VSDGTLDAPAGARHVNTNVVLAVLAVAQFMVVLDMSVVNVAPPTIKQDLGFLDQSLSWILNADTLVFGGLMLLGGRAADGLGQWREEREGDGRFSA
jgi:MFS family permease